MHPAASLLARSPRPGSIRPAPLEPADDRLPHRAFGSLVGASGVMQRTFELLERAAPTDATVLLTGETGTGKEATASSIHRNSARVEGPFVVVDCSAIPPTLLESELFGHERGAFTGANARRIGALEAADGGTLFLDEIGELPLDLQPKLLRALEGRRVKPLGCPTERPVDVRVIAATNRDLRDEVASRRFRADLYYRLAVVEIHLPPLRDRAEDIPILVEHLLASRRSRSPVPAFVRSPEFLARLPRHDWPGNVRELRNYLDRCVALGEAGPFDATARPMRDVDPSPTTIASVDPDRPFREQREEWLRAFEVHYLERLLARHEGNVAAAARAAGLDRVYLYRLLWRNGLR